MRQRRRQMSSWRSLHKSDAADAALEEKMNKIDSKKVAVFCKKNMILLVLIAFIIILSVASDTFLTSSNLLSILRQVSVKGIIGFGMMAVLITGGIDLGAAYTLALVTVTTAKVANLGADAGVGYVFLAILTGILTGAVVGIINGLIIAYLKIPAFVVTLGMSKIVNGIALTITNGRQIVGFSKAFDFLGKGYVLGLPFPVFIFIVLAVVSAYLFKYKKFGKHTYALGGNKNAARVSGINIGLSTLKVYIFEGLMVGIAGVIFCSRLSCGNATCGTGYELEAIAASVIGGVSLTGGIGNPIGVVIGTILLGVINNGLDMLKVSAYMQLVVMGAIIIIAVVVDNLKNKGRN